MYEYSRKAVGGACIRVPNGIGTLQDSDNDPLMFKTKLLHKESARWQTPFQSPLNSAKNSEAERKRIASKMRWELLVLRSFGRLFAKMHGVVVKENRLDELWQNEIYDTLQLLRKDFADYVQLAGQEDTRYQEYSPWYNQEENGSTAIEFDINELVPEVQEASLLTKIWLDGKAKMKKAGIASKWALWDRKRLETLVQDFQQKNSKLKDILQLATATQQHAISETIQMFLLDDDAKLLGLAAHAEIRRLICQPESNKVDFNLESATLESEHGPESIRSGICRINVGRGNIVEERVLIEYKDYDSVSGGLEHSESPSMQMNTKSRVHQLASLLSSSGLNKLGTLPFRGIVEQPDQSRHAFIFDYPPDAAISPPESLHSIINNPSSSKFWPLAARFKVAQSIAKALGAFHADGWVHKSIRSQSVVFFKRHNSKDHLVDAPYLVDFQYSRPESGSTLLLRNSDDEKNLYRHPKIQDVARSSFSKAHDIYSLGVLLLEIAVWQSARSMLDEMLRRGRLKPGSVNAAGIQKMYIKCTEKRVGHLMGASYQSAFLACLESRYENQTHRQDFPMVFREEVREKLSVKSIA